MTTLNLLDWVDQMKEDKARYLQETSFEECTQLREVAFILEGRDFANRQAVIDVISEELGLEPELSEDLILKYNSLIEVPKDRLGGTAVRVGVKYFSGESIEQISDETKYSKGEIRRNLRIFVSQSEDRVLRPLEFRTTYPSTDYLEEDYLATLSETMSEFSFEGLLDDWPEIDRDEFPFSWLRFLTVTAYNEVNEIYEEAGEEKVREVLANTLEETDIHEYIEDTEWFQGDRKELYFDAVEAYREERYSLAIPLSLTQIDGLVIELATELGIWELDDNVTGVKIIDKSTAEKSEKYIDEVDDFLADRYKRLMGRGTRRAKVLHGIETDFANDREFAAELIWFWISVFYLVDRISSQNSVSDSNLLKFFAVSEPQTVNEVAERFDSQPLYVETYLDTLSDKGYLDQKDERYGITESGEEYLLELEPKFVLD